MTVGAVVDFEQFTVLVNAGAISGDRERMLAYVPDFEDVAVICRKLNADDFTVERVISDEKYEAIDSNMFRYNAFQTINKLALGQSPYVHNDLSRWRGLHLTVHDEFDSERQVCRDSSMTGVVCPVLPTISPHSLPQSGSNFLRN